MKTVFYTKNEICEVAKELRNGKVFAFPTDTVYGLGVVYHNEEALTALKWAKGRPENKPIPTMVASVEQLKDISVLTKEAELLVRALMPGPLTIIVEKKSNLEEYHTNGLSTIGVRMPDDEFVLDLINAVNSPMLVTSANLSGGSNCFSSDEVLRQLDGRIDGIVVGIAKGTQASTIVDVSNGVKILREGPISASRISEILGGKEE